eukprot:9473467-Prorocentrum_lima.AAC.1
MIWRRSTRSIVNTQTKTTSTHWKRPTWISGCNCGLAFPSKMWRRTSGWEFYCSVEWQVVKAEGQKDSDPKNP